MCDLTTSPLLLPKKWKEKTEKIERDRFFMMFPILPVKQFLWGGGGSFEHLRLFLADSVHGTPIHKMHTQFLQNMHLFQLGH